MPIRLPSGSALIASGGWVDGNPHHEGVIVARANCRRERGPGPPLNLHLFVTVIGFGSRNVGELEPLLERATTAIPLEGIDADGY